MSNKKGVSFYFFDFDDNIMVLPTHLLIKNTITKEIKEITSAEFALINPNLGKAGSWADWSCYSDTFIYFNDIPPDKLGKGDKQYFVRDIEKAISANTIDWQGPSWNLFQGACKIKAPVSIVTARGHSADTIKEGIKVLFDKGLISNLPNYHTIFPVSNKDKRLELGDKDFTMTIPALKKLAIIKSVNDGINAKGKKLQHRFGMSDDDPENVRLIITAMRDCKNTYPDNRFFVINTHDGEKVKLEVFPFDIPVNTKLEAYKDALE